MTAKEYLGRAYKLEQQIKTRIEKIDTLNAQATKCTSVLSDMPKGSSMTTSSMAEMVYKIVELRMEINHYIDMLVDVKTEIEECIGRVVSHRQRELLMRRYIQYQSMGEIAEGMGIKVKGARKLHTRALTAVESLT